MSHRKLASILVDRGVISQAQREEALAEQNGNDERIGEVLIRRGFADEESVARALADQFRLPFVEIDDRFSLEQEEAALVPESVARKHNVLPMKKEKAPRMTLIMSDPLDLEALDVVRALTRLEVHKAVAAPGPLRRAIDKFYTQDAYIERNLQDLVELETDEPVDEQGSKPVESDQLRLQANDAPVVKFVNLLLMQAVRDRASDIHFEPGEKNVTVRIRIDGVLREVTPPPKSLYQAVVTRVKILSNMDITERRLPQDGRFKFKVKDRIIDVRVSALPEVYGEKLVLRILDRESLIEEMSDIGMAPDMLARFQDILRMPHGIVLITGPTGSGKTTTLYSALNYLKNVEKNIQTVEDPVEYLIDGINQMQIKPAIGLDFASALRSILRQDPDIIMIGEIRDLDTAQIAMRASLTGHIVLSTLHTNDAPSAFCRLKDLGIPPYLIAATVKLVISQRLVRLNCPNCAVQRPFTEAECALVRPYFAEAASWQTTCGEGCEQCGSSRFHGRSGIFEFLEVNEDVRALILSDIEENKLRKQVIEWGMEPLVVNGLNQVRDGRTSLSELLRVWPIDERDATPLRESGDESVCV